MSEVTRKHLIPRYAKARALRDAGLTYKAIGLALGGDGFDAVTPGRARAIILDHDRSLRYWKGVDERKMLADIQSSIDDLTAFPFCLVFLRNYDQFIDKEGL